MPPRRPDPKSEHRLEDKITTSTLEVGDLLSVLGAQRIEKQLRLIAGVNTVSVSPVSGATTVDYDPAKTTLLHYKLQSKNAVFTALVERCSLAGRLRTV